MSSDIKQSLKDANSAFRNKENDKAIRICKEVIKKDPGNYMAHVLMGAIYQNSSKAEAEKYLRKALTLSKEPISALQGLATCVAPEYCPEIYGKLLELTPNKFEELHSKLLRTSTEISDISTLVRIYEKELSLAPNGDNAKRIESAYLHLSELLLKQKEVDEKFSNIFSDSLMHTLHMKDVYQQERYKKYLRLLNDMGQKDLLIEKAIEMHDLFKNDNYPLEWICKIYVESFDAAYCLPSGITDKISYYIESLLEKYPTSSIGLLSKGLNLLNEGMVIEAREIVDCVIKETPNWATALQIMAKIHFKTEAYDLASNIWEHLNVRNADLASCYVEQEYQLDNAVKICKTILKEKSDDPARYVLLGKAQILQKSKEVEETMNLLEKLGYTSEVNYLKAFSTVRDNKNYEEAFGLIEKQTSKALDTLLLKGEILYHLEKTNASLLCFKQANELYPWSSRSFFWLSRAYKAMDDDAAEVTALERCIVLNPIQREALLRLCSVYRAEGRSDKVEELLLQGVSHVKDSNMKWMWLQLGLHYISVDKNDNAINTFRTLLRFDKRDFLGWECLADAYFNNGSYSSALKIYQRIVEETEDNIYCKYQVANIKTILGQYTEAIGCFKVILDYHPMYVPALKGIAEAHFSLGNVLMRQRRLGSMRDQLQKAAFYATRACELKSVCCHWALLGNILLKVANLPRNLASIDVRSYLYSPDNTDDVIGVNGDEIFEVSSRCFLRAIKENAEDGLLWYNLAVCLYLRGCRISDKMLKQEYLRKAMLYVKQSIALKSNRWQNWNMLGAISVKLGNVCQALHCFVKALRLNKTSAMAWCNLGLMYLNEGEKWLKYHVDDGESQEAVLEELRNLSIVALRSANKAFGRSQQSNHEYLNAWIGQAITAERLEKMESAMDLFRHCTQLEYHVEAAMGYSRFVCSLINDPEKLKEGRYQYYIQSMFALPRAHDSITWSIVDQGENASAVALCLQGCLSYKSKLYHAASEAFEKALKIAKTPHDRDLIACNLGYCKIKQNKFNEAIDAFEKVQKTTFRSSFGLAFSYYKGTLHIFPP
uniref:Uncharacterized protein n=1 Tax=Phlebotomus papatasi TaxID=29031 RepID=A0A1B0DNB2_PHLPP